MAPREILVVPDRRLRQVTRPVETIDGAVRRLVRAMLAAMYRANGIGLAAPQVGEPVRVVTIDLAERGERQLPRVFINPMLAWRSEQTTVGREGCLSVPGRYDHVMRSAAIGVSYRDLDGRTRELEATGLLAVCLQHEIDHLDWRGVRRPRTEPQAWTRCSICSSPGLPAARAIENAMFGTARRE